MAPTQLIRKVLSPAVRLWLRSQVDSAEVLSFEVEGSDRQLLSGQIPKISIVGEQVVYQGLSLSHLDIVGEGIKTNLRQVVRGKALQLLEPIFVQATLGMIDRDMNQCLQAPLLANALSEVLDQWLEPLGEAFLEAPQTPMAIVQNTPAGGGLPASSAAPTGSSVPPADSPTQPPSPTSHWREIRMQFRPNALTLWATLDRSTPSAPSGHPTPEATQPAPKKSLTVTMDAIVTLQDPHTIILGQLRWDTNHPEATAALASLDHLTLNLGQDVHFTTLALTEGQVVCDGQILIRP